MTIHELALNLRFATDADAPAIAALINAAFKVELFFKHEDRTDTAEIRGFLALGRFLLAEDGAGVAACIYLEVNGERCYLGLLAVDPTRQRSGLGSRMMTAAEDAARAAGCRYMDLRIVNLRTELPAIYKRFGYTEDGTEPWPEHKPTKMPCHFIRMSKSLTASADDRA